MMINFNLVLAKYIQYFFLIFIIYWFPFFSPSIVSNFRSAILIFILLLALFIFSKSFINIKFYILINTVCIYLLLYELTTKGDGSYVIISVAILFFYFLGYYFSKIELVALKKPAFYLLLILSVWVSLSSFFNQLDFRNLLFLDYEYAEVSLNSTGFSLARTSWGLSIFLLSMYFFHIEKKRSNKFLIFIIPFISTMTTATRGGMLYFAIAAFFIILNSSYLKTLSKIFLISILLISTTSIMYFLGDNLRITGVEDISTGRFEQYNLFSRVMKEHWLFGTYSEGFYSLIPYGSSVNSFHNSFLNILLKFGIIGAFPIYLLLIISLVNIIRSFEKTYISLYMLILGGLISTQLEPDSIFSYGYHIFIFWFFLGYLANSKERKYKKLS